MEPYLSVIIPAYNEEKRVSKSLTAVYEYLAGQPYQWEVLVVIDGATDHTLEVVRSFSSGKENLRWIDRKENRGKGYTVREGMLAARGRIRLFTDADNSTDIAHFDKMMPLFERGYEVVICSREAKDAEGACQAVPQPYYKRLLGRVGNLLVQAVAVRGIWDTQCGFKAFTKSAAEAIFSVSRIDRWGFDIEALALARRFGFRTGIVPAYWVDDTESNVRLVSYLGVLVDTGRVRWNLINGAYGK